MALNWGIPRSGMIEATARHKQLRADPRRLGCTLSPTTGCDVLHMHPYPMVHGQKPDFDQGIVFESATPGNGGGRTPISGYRHFCDRFCFCLWEPQWCQVFLDNPVHYRQVLALNGVCFYLPGQFGEPYRFCGHHPPEVSYPGDALCWAQLTIDTGQVFDMI